MEIIIIIILILLNGLFSMSEMSLVSARKNRLEMDAKKNVAGAKTALKLANNPNSFFSTVQIGITLIGLFTGIYSGDKITSDVEELIKNIDVLAPYSKSLSTIVVLIVITFFSLVLGELVPKRLGLNYPESIAKAVAIPMDFMSRLTSPFVWLLTKSSDLLIKILGIKPNSDNRITEEEIITIIKEGKEDGEVQEIEQDIVERVFNIGDRNINSLMTHRKLVTFIDIKDTLEEIKEKVLNNLHFSYPVCENDNLDAVIGVVSLKDLFLMFEKKYINLKSIIKEPIFLIEHTSAYKTLENFKSTKNHFALITDEYGVVQGVVTMNDILEALVGDASEFEEEYKLQEIEENYWVVDGFYPLHDMIMYFELEDEENIDYDITTLGGLITKELSYIPKVGEKLIWNQLEFEILSSNGVKISKVGIRRLK